MRGDQIAENYRVFVLECPDSKGGSEGKNAGECRAKGKEPRAKGF